MMMKEKILELEEDSGGKIVFTEYNDEWFFNVLHYIEPMKNYIHVATISTKSFEDGFKESLRFLNKNAYEKIYEEEI
jgi:hypothetical protein